MTDSDIDFNDFLGTDDRELVDRRIDAKRQLGKLTQRERAILYLYGCGYTQAEIGEKVGLSQRHIGRILEGIGKKAAGY